MGRLKRAGYLIEWWIGDHLPRHVHVYKGGRFVAKVEIPGLLVLRGKVSGKLAEIIRQLIKERRL